MALQLLPPLTREPRVIEREATAASHLPYAAQLDDHTIVTRDGLLLQLIQLRGLLFETADTDELNYRKRLREMMLQAIGVVTLRALSSRPAASDRRRPAGKLC